MTEENTYRSLDDIVFEDRNKEYGAYKLRKSYFFHLKLALGVSVGIVLSLVSFYYIKLRLSEIVPPPKTEVINWEMEDDIEIPEPEVLPPPPPPPPPMKEEVKFTQTKHTDVEVVKKAEADKEAFPDVKKLDSTATGKSNVDGDTTASNLPPEHEGGQEGGKPGGVVDNNVYNSVDGIDANFPGGRSAMESYFSKNLMDARKRAQRLGEKGVVHVMFIIEKDGSVSNVQILKPLHICESCNEEAKQVIENMPHWTPAENKLGHRIRRQMILPIVFTL